MTRARDGVPAHVTVLYPFLPPAEIGPEVRAALARLFAVVPRFSFHPGPGPVVRRVGHLGGPGELRAAAAQVSPLLPITTEATTVILMTGPTPGRASGPPGAPGQWQTVASFPLG